MRHDAILRTLGVLRQLQRGPRTLTELAMTAGVCERTIRRDMDVLSLSGFPVYHDRFDAGEACVWRLAVVRESCPVCERLPPPIRRVRSVPVPGRRRSGLLTTTAHPRSI